MKPKQVINRRLLRPENLLPAVSLAVVLAGFYIAPALAGDQLNVGSYYNTFQNFAPLGLVALALGLTLIAGEFDVSVLGMQTLGGVLAVRAGGHDGLLGVVAAVGACGLLGLVQGLLIARLRLQSMPVTIGTYIALLGLSNVLASNNTLTYGNLGASVWVAKPILHWFCPQSLITIVMFVIVFAVLGLTKLGPELKALGGDRRAARVCGIAVELRLVAIFTCSAALAGLAGALLAYSNASASLDPGLQPLILGTTAAVLGGLSLSGGRGTIWGVAVGSLVVAMLEEIFGITALSNSTTDIVFGGMLLLIVSVDAPDHRTTVQALTSRLRIERVARDLTTEERR